MPRTHDLFEAQKIAEGLTPLTCCQCGAVLPDQTKAGFDPVPEEYRGKLLCNDCHQAEDGFGDDEDA